MSEQERSAIEQRVLFLAPTDRDGGLARSILERAGVACDCCSDLSDLCAGLEVGAGVVLLPEEVVVSQEYGRLTSWLERQPPWSDMPLLLLARPGADSAPMAKALDMLGNVTVLERPIRVAALVSAVRAALRARQRQYQIRDHLAEHARTEQALRDADRRKDEFLAILSHELRNPLAPIRHSLHLLNLTAAKDSPSQHVVEMMERQVVHMVRLVDDLLEASRISRGTIELRKERIELAAVVRSAIEISRPLIEGAGHQLSLSIPAEPLTLEGDFVRLTQVIANLLNNASKYSDAGAKIWLAVQREGGEVVVSVRDAGVGIAPETLPRVFDLFMQVDRHGSRAQGGLGIGLTLVKSLVELHGGTVEARSDGLGRGSEFRARLPLVAATSQAVNPTPVPRLTTVSSRRRVLVADDNRDAADSLGALLQLLGADVCVVYDGAAALDALGTFKPAVVLLDIGMPKMDGLEAARKIRRLPGGEDLTLIALSGWGRDEDRDRSRSAGFDFHLIKPTDLGALQHLLVSVEGGSARRGSIRVND